MSVYGILEKCWVVGLPSMGCYMLEETGKGFELGASVETDLVMVMRV